MDPISKVLGNSAGSERVCLFAEKCLGFHFTDWQIDRIIQPLYDTLNSIGLRRYRNGYISMARKCGKTTLVAVSSAYHLYGDNEPKPRVYAAASSREQAALTYDPLASFVERSPVLATISQGAAVSQKYPRAFN